MCTIYVMKVILILMTGHCIAVSGEPGIRGCFHFAGSSPPLPERCRSPLTNGRYRETSNATGHYQTVH